MVINFHIIAKYFSSTSFVKRSILCVLSLSCLIGIFLGFILCDLIPSVQDVGDENHSVIGQLSTMKPKKAQ